MKKFKKAPKIIVITAIIVSLGAIVFGGYALAWHEYVSATFAPFSTALDSLEMQKDTSEMEGWDVSTYKDKEGGGYVFTVARPPFLEYEGNISILTPTEVDFVDGQMIRISEYLLDLSYYPRDGLYVLRIADFTSATDPRQINSLSSTVDKYGQPLGRHPDDSEEFYQEWLSLHEKFNEPIMEMFDTIRDIFGDDALK